MNRILHDRQLEEYYCTLCYAQFDFKQRLVTMSNSGLPYPIHSSADGTGQVHLPGVPLGSFPGITYDELTIPLHAGDVFVFCSDGIYEAMDAEGSEFTAERLLAVVERTRTQPAKAIVDAIYDAVYAFCGDAEPNDDRTAVVLKVTA
jgi:sigma-B regulation protein RsbU (phosphoserine phosphatase)